MAYSAAVAAGALLMNAAEVRAAEGGALAAGLSGYHYAQIEADSGTAPRDFKGQATALGPALNYNFLAGQRPVALKAKILKEFNTRNRLEGTAALAQLAIPLGG